MQPYIRWNGAQCAAVDLEHVLPHQGSLYGYLKITQEEYWDAYVIHMMSSLSYQHQIQLSFGVKTIPKIYHALILMTAFDCRSCT